MQLGITALLQKYLKLPVQPYGEPIDLFFCWEVQIVKYQGKNTLVAVNANNRYGVVMTGIKSSEWKQLSKLMIEAIESGMLQDGYTKEQIDAYFLLAGKWKITKTHGRKPVGGLNRAIDYLHYIPEEMTKQQKYQPLHCRQINKDICVPIGFKDYGYPVEFFRNDMERVGIIKKIQGEKGSNIIEFRRE